MNRRYPHAHPISAQPLLVHLPAHGAAALLTVLLALLFPSAGWALLALILCLAFLATLAATAPAAFILLGPILVLRATELLSGVAIEGGATMVETGVRGVASGAFARLWLLNLLTFSAAAVLISWGWHLLHRRFASAGRSWRRHALPLAAALSVLLGGMTLILAWFAFRHGIPGVDRIDRFAYLNRLEGTPYRTIMMNRVLLAPLIGVVIAVSRTRLFGLALLAWLMTLSLLFGEKFTSLLFIVGGAVQPLALLTVARSGMLPWRALSMATLALISICLPAILFTYGAIDDPRRAWIRLEQRAVLQGQLWYLADSRGAPTRTDTAAFRDDVASWADPRVQRPEIAGTRFGLYYVMSRFTPSHRLDDAVAAKNGFVFAFYPYLLLAGGWFALLAAALLIALLQAAVLLLVAQALDRGRWLAILAFGRVANSIQACLVSGYLWNIAGPKTLLAFGVGCLLLVRWSNNPVAQKRINKI